MQKDNYVYISGKVTGCNDYKEKFENAENVIKEKRLGIPINPVKITDSFDPEKTSYLDYMRFDIDMLLRCQKIYMLKNWRKSKGARFERLVAKFFELEIIYE